MSGPQSVTAASACACSARFCRGKDRSHSNVNPRVGRVERVAPRRATWRVGRVARPRGRRRRGATWRTRRSDTSTRGLEVSTTTRADTSNPRVVPPRRGGATRQDGLEPRCRSVGATGSTGPTRRKTLSYTPRRVAPCRTSRQPGSSMTPSQPARHTRRRQAQFIGCLRPWDGTRQYPPLRDCHRMGHLPV